MASPVMLRSGDPSKARPGALEAEAAATPPIGDHAAEWRRVRNAVALARRETVQTRARTFVAADLTPAQAAALDREIVAGIVLANGSPTAHSAILTRSRGIPAVVGAGPDVLGIADGTTVALDGEAGRLVVDPDPETLVQLKAQVAERDRLLAERWRPRPAPR